MSIRFAFLADHPEHIATVASWHWSEWDRDMLGLTYEQVEDLVRAHSLNTDRLDMNIIAVTDANECIGTVELADNEFLPQYKGVSPWLGSLYMLPEWRGQGIARQLVQEMIQHAHAAGFTTLYCFTHVMSEAFMTTFDFQYVETVPFSNVEWRVYRMQKE